MSYSLSFLFKVRTHKEFVAQIKLEEASKNHSKALDGLSSIKNSLDKNLHLRILRQNSFFLKSKTSGCSNKELMHHVASQEKSLTDEQDLKISYNSQEEQVNYTAIRWQVAQADALYAKKNLKIIENHHATWLKKEQRKQSIIEEYKVDDFNCIKYCLNNKINER